MDKEVKKLLLRTIKYHLGSGVLASLVIALASTFTNAMIYLVGICVAVANFLVYGYIVERYLGKERKQWVISVTYFIRMAVIVATFMPFIRSIEYMIYYMAGFISHYILLIGLSIKNRKGSV